MLFPGHDVLKPATRRFTWLRDEPVIVDIPDVKDGGPMCDQPITVMTALRQTASVLPDHIALGKYRRPPYRCITFFRALHGFVKLVLKKVPACVDVICLVIK